MNKDILKRNEMIYDAYRVGIDIETTAARFNLKASTVRKIISKHKKEIKERDESMEDLYLYLKSNLRHNIATNVYHSLQRYINYRSIYTKEDLKQLIESDVHIRNIGTQSKNLLRRYFGIKEEE